MLNEKAIGENEEQENRKTDGQVRSSHQHHRNPLRAKQSAHIPPSHSSCITWREIPTFSAFELAGQQTPTAPWWGHGFRGSSERPKHVPQHWSAVVVSRASQTFLRSCALV